MIFPMENNGDLPVPSTMTSQETTPEVVQRLQGLKTQRNLWIRTLKQDQPMMLGTCFNMLKNIEKHYIQMNMSENREKKPTKWIQMAMEKL
jgi:predicted nucleic acid-binding protein